MKFTDLNISDAVESKLWTKHQVDADEVQEVFRSSAWVRRGPENLYYILGQTSAGRYLILVLADLGAGRARLASGRDMTARERRGFRNR